LEKKMFLRELRAIRHSALPHWLVLEDFNMIYQDQDKSNRRLNINLMDRFRRALNRMEVKGIELVGRKFTWSNNQAQPTLTRIDRAFCSPLWEDFYSNPFLQPLPSSISDYYPLMLLPLHPPAPRPRFRFETY
jgi:hypothetical protein